ncbi:MAG: hypothetical protein AVO38_04505 [delta proteobacterium ML8_D]|jgi:hypothetical protein|nr:MAG: hypothetical protein AVO38_04505 [delta proteobacterium ML8_D]
MSRETEKIYRAIRAQIDAIESYSLEFIFSPARSPYLDVNSISKSFQKEWDALEPLLEQKGSAKELASLLFPDTPSDLAIVPRLHNIFLSAHPHLTISLDICVAGILQEASGKFRSQVSPQLFIELLNHYNLRSPEFLIAINPILQIISDRGQAFSHVIKSIAGEVLVNNYESEALFIFISCAGHLTEEEKQILFQSLTAFQKIYRKLLELHVGIPEKDLISLKWFGIAYDELRSKREYRDSLSNLVRRFIGFLKEKDKEQAIPVGRFLVLRFNNEDILRIVRYEIEKDPALSSEAPMTKFIYRQTYKIMQEFRRHYIPGEVDKVVTRSLSETEQHAIDTMRLVSEGRTPASMVIKGQLQRSRSAEDYVILPEFMENLHTFNLQALFELYVIPPLSQRIFNILAAIGDTMELGRDELFQFILYLENILFFLQELEESGIEVRQDPTYGLIKNPYQLHSLSMIREGTYFSSTGLWYQNTIPPSIIRCISPNALPNCIGVRDRHIFSQISLVTGGFRGTPFDLDSTNRYDWDEEPENCLFRPGYFQIVIPQPLQERWEVTQAMQKAALKGLIQKKQWS